MPVARGGHIIRVLPVEARFLLDGPFVVLPPARLDPRGGVERHEGGGLGAHGVVCRAPPGWCLEAAYGVVLGSSPGGVGARQVVWGALGGLGQQPQVVWGAARVVSGSPCGWSRTQQVIWRPCGWCRGQVVSGQVVSGRLARWCQGTRPRWCRGTLGGVRGSAGSVRDAAQVISRGSPGGIGNARGWCWGIPGGGVWGTGVVLGAAGWAAGVPGGGWKAFGGVRAAAGGLGHLGWCRGLVGGLGGNDLGWSGRHLGWSGRHLGWSWAPWVVLGTLGGV